MKSRKRNIARKSKNAASRTGSASARINPNPQLEQRANSASQDPPQAKAANLPPGPGSRNPDPGLASRISPPEAGNGFVSQNHSNDANADNLPPDPGPRIPDPGLPPTTEICPGETPPPICTPAEKNRANAQYSTGPRTAEGKAASAQNAFKHGLSIQRHAVLRDEDPAQYAQLLSELREIYEPRARREALAVEDIAQCRWALQRFDEAEAVCLQKLTDWYNDPEDLEGEEIIGTGECLGHAATVLTDINDNGHRYVEPDTHYPAFDKIHRYRTHWERKHARALAEFDRAQRARRADERQGFAREAAAQRAERHSQQTELHELRLALARKKLEREPAKHNTPTNDPATDAAFKAFESVVNAPTPMTEADFLRQRGFVSQNRTPSSSGAHTGNVPQ